MQNPIQQIRKENNLNRTQFAQKSGISYSTLCYLETGRGNMIQQKTLEVLAKFSGKPGDAIQGEYRKWKESLVQLA